MPSFILPFPVKKEKLFSIVTDYGNVHKFWAFSPSSKYFVSDEVASKTLKKIAQSSKVIVSGIPVRKKFIDVLNEDKEDLKKKLGIPSGKIVAIFTGGGIGNKKLVKLSSIIRDKKAWGKKLEFIFVCGRNRKVFNKVLNNFSGIQHAKVFGFTDKMHELMRVSDIAFIKPGGLTVTETIFLGLPTVIFDFYPGQEEENVKHILKMNYGWLKTNIKDLSDFIEELSKNPSILNDKKKSLLSRKKENPIEIICKEIFENLDI